MKLFKPRFPPTKWNCRSEQNTNLSAVHKAERRKHTWNLELTTGRQEANSNTVVNIYAQARSTHPVKLTVLPKENGIYLKTTWENVSTLPPWGKAMLWAQKRIVSRASASTMLHKTRVQGQPVSKVMIFFSWLVFKIRLVEKSFQLKFFFHQVFSFLLLLFGKGIKKKKNHKTNRYSGNE